MATKIKFQSPLMTARYPHISKPDTVGKFADNKFKTKAVMPLGDPQAQAFIKTIDEAAVEIHGKKGEKLYKPYVIDEDANEVVFNFKTQYAPAIFDSKKNPVKETVGGGSVIRVAGQFVEFDKGITAQFNQVQVKELNGFGSCAFDEIDDGFQTTDADTPAFDAADEELETTSGSSALDI